MKTILAGRIAAVFALAALAAYTYHAHVTTQPLVMPPPIPISPAPDVPLSDKAGQPGKPPVPRFGPPGWATGGMGLPAPLSRVRQEGPWDLYSRAVNQITCADTIGSGGAEETWLGTQGGIKRLDVNGRLLKLYTDRDGLPGSSIVALAVEPKEAWCVVIADRVPSVYSLCRLDRTTDRWETLRQVPVPAVSCTDQTNADSFIAAGASHSVCFVLGNIARSQSGIAAFVLNRASHSWEDVAWNVNPSSHGCFPYVEPYWAWAGPGKGGGCLYVGTPEGLGRYRIADRRWDWFLTDHSILGGTGAGGGNLWLAALTKTDTNLIPATASLHLLRFDANQETVTADYEQAGANAGTNGSGENRLTFPGTAASVVGTSDGGIWLLNHRAPGFFRSLDPPATSLTQFNIGRHDWRPADTSVPSAAQGLPLPVLRAALLAGYALPTATLQRRLPGWSSPAASLPVDAAAVPGQDPAPEVPDSDDSVWGVADKNVLTRRTISAAAVQRFPPPIKTMLLTPMILNVALAGNTLYALTPQNLWSRRLPNGAWTPHPLLPGMAGFRPSETRLVTLGGQLWIQIGGTLRCWNTPGKTLALPPGGYSVQPLGMTGNDFWFQENRGEILFRLHSDTGTSEMIRVNIFEQDHNSAGFIGFAGGLAWIAVQEGAVQQGDTLLYGYDVQTRSWSARLRLAGHVDNFALQTATGGVYATVVQRLDATGEGPVGDTYCFNLQTRQWKTVAPTVPPAPGTPRYAISPDHVRFASMEKNALWLVDTNALAACRWDLARHVWNYYPAAQTGRVQGTDEEGTVVSQGSFAYVATQNGVWRFDLGTQRWISLPMPLSAGSNLTLRPCAVDSGAVWALAYGPTRQAFAARFDKAKHTWKLWDAASGFPETGEPTAIAGDGVSALAAAYLFGAYHLNPKTDRWDNVSPALANALTGGKNDTDLFARNLRSDPPLIWIRTTGYWNKNHSALTPKGPPVPPLVRWNGARGLFEPIPPPADTADPQAASAFWSDAFLVTPQAVWLPAREGVWRLDKGTKAWRFLPAPAGFPSPVEELRRTPDGALWLSGRQAVARLSPSAAR